MAWRPWSSKNYNGILQSIYKQNTTQHFLDDQGQVAIVSWFMKYLGMQYIVRKNKHYKLPLEMGRALGLGSGSS